jgi:uncharacterized protein (TIGR02453 family)
MGEKNYRLIHEHLNYQHMAEHFTKEFISFFKELEKNNSTAWFNENKKQYEAFVKLPFIAFVEEVIKAIQAKEPAIKMTGKEALFRINRDTRFGADKSPYKTNMSAAVSVGGKNPGYPGIYFEMSHKGINIICGAYMVEKDNLLSLRKKIAADIKGFQKIVTAKKFKETFGTILGEKSKLLPEELKKPALVEPLILNKQFYYAANLPVKSITEDGLVKTIASYYEAAKEMNQFLIKGLGL